MNEIQKYQGFKAELAIAETFEEIKFVENKAAAAAEFARRNKIGVEEQNEWGKFRVEIEIKKGEWLEKMFPHGGNRTSSSSTSLQNENITYVESAQARNILRNQEKVNEVIDQIKTEGKEIITPSLVNSKLKTIAKKEEIKKLKDNIASGMIVLPEGLFEVIMMDVPWPYNTEYDSGNMLGRSAAPYPEMSIDEIKQLPIPAADDSILFFWTTQKFLHDAFHIIEEYGFEYKATLVWDKQKMGIGKTLRLQCEFCLVAFKGNPIWNVTTLRDLISVPRREHSRKPDELYQIINESLVGRKLDYFSRENREGWETFGYEKFKK